jgi:hypothetical protein
MKSKKFLFRGETEQRPGTIITAYFFRSRSRLPEGFLAKEKEPTLKVDGKEKRGGPGRT